MSNIQSKYGAHVCARRRAHDKFEKCELSAFTVEKINKTGEKAKILEKSENAHEIQKNLKKSSLCPGEKNSRSTSHPVIRFEKATTQLSLKKTNVIAFLDQYLPQSKTRCRKKFKNLDRFWQTRI